VPGSRLTGLRFFHVIAFPGQLGSLALLHTKIKLALVSCGSSDIDWAGFPHVILG